MDDKTLKKILRARVYDVAIESPLDKAPFISKRSGNRVLIKREDLQPVFSFKIRGAYNKMVQLTDAEKKRGVIASSAGNHAQGVALSAAKLSIKATIVMPRTTPDIKVVNVRERGAKVILHGDNYDAAYAHAKELSDKKKLTFIHPYDDLDIIAGQGTVAREILHQHSDPIEAIFVPAGGGGLISGIALYTKMIRPDVKVIGVEPEDSACLNAALKAGKPVTLKDVGNFADGAAVKRIGKETFKICKKHVDEVVTVNNDEICAAIKDIFNDNRTVAEPAGALALAGLKKYAEERKLKNKTLVAIESGANVNFDRLRHISERSEIGEKREALLAVTIPEKPGSFKTFCKALEDRSITEFNYRYSDANDAQIFVGIKLLSEKTGVKPLIKMLKKKGYSLEDMSDNEMAKVHIRHMVGGRGKGVPNEHVFTFEFPERPGALMKFLTHLGKRWNISMFHYRNYGADYGRVLLGLQIPASDRPKSLSFLKALGYAFTDESDNPAYKLFLS